MKVTINSPNWDDTCIEEIELPGVCPKRNCSADLTKPGSILVWNWVAQLCEVNTNEELGDVLETDFNNSHNERFICAVCKIDLHG